MRAADLFGWVGVGVTGAHIQVKPGCVTNLNRVERLGRVN